MSDLVRVNIRVSPQVHKWFTERSKSTGVSMSALMFLACEKYMQEQMFMGSNLPALLQLANQMNLVDDEDKQLVKTLSEAVLDGEKGA